MSDLDFMNMAAGWKCYQGLHLEANLTEENLEVVRNVFYAGASCIMRAQQNIYDQHETSAAAMILLDALHEELVDWIKE